jgi:peptidoglycan hydrolase CwlO-like protein
MSNRWEEMTAHQKLSTLRSEIESLGRVVDSVAGRIDKLKGELRIIQSQLGQSAGDKVPLAPTSQSFR